MRNFLWLAILGLLVTFFACQSGANAAETSLKRVELNRRMAIWSARASTCIFKSFPPYASKFADDYKPDHWEPSEDLNDGDSMMFNGLLCASGDDRGCEAAKLSQEQYGPAKGRWWRSPKRRWEQAAE